MEKDLNIQLFDHYTEHKLSLRQQIYNNILLQGNKS